MENTGLRIGIVGCGRAARVHVPRLLARGDVRLAGLVDLDPDAARALADQVGGTDRIPTFTDHRELLSQAAPQAVAIFTPHRVHYRVALDALQTGCHVFIEKPLSTNAQEAVDIANLARARGLKVGVGHQYRLQPSLVETRRRIADGVIGRVRLVTALMTAPWLEQHSGPADAWRLDPRISGGGMLADTGDHLLDILLWTTGQHSAEAVAYQDRGAAGIDLVTAAALRLADGTPVTMALSAVSPGVRFELTYHGELGRLVATDLTLTQKVGTSPAEPVPLAEPAETIDGNFVSAVVAGTPLCCPAEEALETVRLLETITRSAAAGQAVRSA